MFEKEIGIYHRDKPLEILSTCAAINEISVAL